jgi:hypothetical protein
LRASRKEVPPAASDRARDPDRKLLLLLLPPPIPARPSPMLEPRAPCSSMSRMRAGSILSSSSSRSSLSLVSLTSVTNSERSLRSRFRLAVRHMKITSTSGDTASSFSAKDAGVIGTLLPPISQAKLAASNTGCRHTTNAVMRKSAAATSSTA